MKYILYNVQPQASDSTVKGKAAGLLAHLSATLLAPPISMHFPI